MEKVRDFLMHSYYTDNVAFYLEIISTILLICASATLAFTADSPDMRIVYPVFFIGSFLASIAHFRRRLAWPMIINFWFLSINVLGFGVAMAWWL